MNMYQEVTSIGAYNLKPYRCGMRNVHILHICTYYIGNKLYKNLIGNLSTKEVEQTVYVPIKNKNQIGKNQLNSNFKSVKYHYSHLLNKLDRIFYKRKIYKQLKDIEEKVISNSTPEIIHAHTIFSDGGTAYLLFKKYDIKYIVNVRNTDINFFFKYAVHLRSFMYKILLNANSIVFISHAYKQLMFSLLPTYILKEIEKKCKVIPNGIDQFWHENSRKEKKLKQLKKINLLFIGLINKNKNLNAVLFASEKLIKKGYDISLQVIGNGPEQDSAEKLCMKLKIHENVTFHGFIKEKEKILEFYRTSDIFIMPSFRETFGLVYIEAMSQGLPIVYSKGQGIDGYFKEGEVGYSVDPTDYNSLVSVVEKILPRYNIISENCYLYSGRFNWERVSQLYIEAYYKTLNK